MNTPVTRIRARRARKDALLMFIMRRIDRIEERLIEGQLRAEAAHNRRVSVMQGMSARGLNGGLLR